MSRFSAPTSSSSQLILYFLLTAAVSLGVLVTLGERVTAGMVRRAMSPGKVGSDEWVGVVSSCSVDALLCTEVEYIVGCAGAEGVIVVADGRLMV